MQLKIKKLYEQTKTLPTQAIQTYAASTSFFLLLAVIPTVMFLLALMQYTPLANVDILAHIAFTVPGTVQPLVDEVINDIETNGSAVLISASAATAIYTAARGINALMKGMNVMYGINDDRGTMLKWVIAAIYSVLTVILILATAVFLVLADNISSFVTKLFPRLAALVDFIVDIRMVTMIVIMIFFFTLIYLVLPNRRARMIHQLPGAVFSALGWIVSSFLFSFYLDHFSRYSQIYGSLTTIIVTMIWVYMLISILFVGALVNVIWANMFIKSK